ncbi:MAG TPA: hypothetical protein GXZ36_05290 [Firmicutes bacterium]|nr:hypothetical protein [Bacillota bacterium]
MLEGNRGIDREQTHVHEFLGSTLLASPPKRLDLLHNHRFAGVTGEAIPTVKSHVHILKTNTDFFVAHYHTMEVKTGEAIPVYDENKKVIGHIHGFTGVTSFDAGHRHIFKGNTLIENPSGPIEADRKDEYSNELYA